MQIPNKKTFPEYTWIIPLLISGVVYFMTVCRTVYVGDSGEFSLVFKTLGIAHPPGYPLFTLIGHFFITITPFLRPAFSANLLSVLIAAITVVVIFFILDGKKQPVFATILALVWAFSASLWSETSGVEVYGLNIFFIAVIVLISFAKSPYKWLLLAYLAGLSLAHHPSILALFPALAFWMIIERKQHHWKPIGGMALLFVIGLSVYIYLPVRASLSPVANWGHPVNIQLLVNHISGSQYQQAAEFTLSNLFASLKLFFNLLLSNWWWLGVLLILVGVWGGIKQHSKRTIFLLILLVSNLLLVSFYRIPDIDPYYLPGLFACFLLITDAIYYFWNKQTKIMRRQAIVVAGGIAVLLLLVMNYGRMDKSGHTLAEDYGRLILDTAGSGILFTTDDISSFPALYLRYAEGYKPNIEIYDKAVRFKALVDEVYRKTGKFAGDYIPARNAFLSQADGEVHFVKSYYPFNTELSDIAQTYHSNGILFSSVRPANRRPLPEFKMAEDATDFKSRQILINLELCRAQEAIQPGKTNQLKAIQAFQKAIDYLEHETRASMLNQLGVSFRHLKQRELALQTYEKALTAQRITKTEKAEIRFNMSNIYKDRGNELAGLNDLGAALQAFVTALEYDPENVTLLYNVGIIYVNFLKQPERGLPYLEAYLEQNPSDRNVRDMVNSIEQ